MSCLVFADGSPVAWNSRIEARPFGNMAAQDIGQLYTSAVFEERGGHTLLGRLGDGESVAAAMRRRGAAFAEKIPASQAGSFVLWSRKQDLPLGLHIAWDVADSPKILTGEHLLAPHDAIVSALTQTAEKKGLFSIGQKSRVLYAAMLCLDPRLMPNEGLSRDEQNAFVAWVMGTYHRQALEAGYSTVMMFFAHAALQRGAPVLASGLGNREIVADIFKVAYSEMPNVGPLAGLDGGAVALVNQLGPTSFDAWVGAVLDAKNMEEQLKAKL